MKDLTTVKEGKATTIQDRSEKNGSQKNERHRTDGQNTALSCTVTRPTEIPQCWTVSPGLVLFFGALGAEQDKLRWGPQEPFLATVKRDGNSHGSGISSATTATPKPSFRAPWSVGDAVVRTENTGWTTSKSSQYRNCSRWSPAENTGWTTSKSRRPCQYRNCSRWSPAEKTARGSLLHELSHMSPPPPRQPDQSRE